MNIALTADARGTAKTRGHASVSLLPTHPGAWVQYTYEQLFSLCRHDSPCCSSLTTRVRAVLDRLQSKVQS